MTRHIRVQLPPSLVTVIIEGAPWCSTVAWSRLKWAAIVHVVRVLLIGASRQLAWEKAECDMGSPTFTGDSASDGASPLLYSEETLIGPLEMSEYPHPPSSPAVKKPNRRSVLGSSVLFVEAIPFLFIGDLRRSKNSFLLLNRIQHFGWVEDVPRNRGAHLE